MTTPVDVPSYTAQEEQDLLGAWFANTHWAPELDDSGPLPDVDDPDDDGDDDSGDGDDLDDDAGDDAKKAETKAAIRHVRTAAGVHRFHLPVGSPITGHGDGPGLPHTDSMAARATGKPAAPSKPSAGRTARSTVSKETSKPKKLTKADIDKLFDPKTVQWHTSKESGNVTRLHYEPEGTGLKIVVAHHPFYTEWAVHKVRPGSPKSEYGSTVTETLDNGVVSGYGDMHERETRIRALRAAKTQYRVQAVLDKTGKRKKNRGYDNFFDYYEGVYGFDYQNADDEDYISEEDFDDPRIRKDIAQRESNALGIRVIGDPITGEDMEINSHETINSVARVHETMYPGFLTFTKGFFYDSHYPNRNALAYNRLNQAHVRFPEDDNYATIAVMPKMFGDHVNVYKNAAELLSEYGGSWWSVSLDEMREDQPDMDDWKLAQINTLVHEFGHSVGHIALGNMKTKHSDGQKQRAQFADGFRAIIEKYDLPGGNTKPEEVFRISPNATFDSRTAYGTDITLVDPEVMQRVLSKYGGTNLQEMMAETWAEYQLSPNPREFARDLGSLMEEIMIGFLNDEFED